MQAEVVSSTRIRELLHQGQVWEASSLLGRLYSVQGEVIHGKNRGGRLLGFPTANLAPTPTMLPKPGVYVTLATPSKSSRCVSTVSAPGPKVGLYPMFVTAG